MERFVLQQLIEWKNSSNRKPLIVKGARQVGKTWALKEFGRLYYKQCLYVNFEDEPQLQDLFVPDFNIDRILNVLQILTGITISSPDETLIVFDEIQAVQRGVTSLKYFYEKAPQYHIASAGSLIGVAQHAGESFPVGKVNFIDVFPLTFGEFLIANSEKALYDTIKAGDWGTLSIFRQRLSDHLKNYFYVGGMPEAVAEFCNSKDYGKVRTIQKEILFAYENDFSKHAPATEIARIRMVWQSIVPQLARENKKFIYGAMKQGARAKEFEIALQWLTDTGLIYKCHRISKPAVPLTAYTDFSAFKVYFLDVGLLGAMAGLDVKSLIKGDELFVEFKGALTEQYVFQEIKERNFHFVAYWTNERNTAEVDFIIQKENTVIPIEVKAGENLMAKSFRLFCEKYKPHKAIRTSLSDYRKEEWFENIPLWGLSFI